MVAAKRMLLVAHDGDRDYALREAGSVLTVAVEQGYDVSPISAQERSWPDPADFDVIVVLGSGCGAWDDSLPWLADELDFLRRVVEVGTPMLAICFGAQALARALGGAAECNVAPEHGITAVSVAEGCPCRAGRGSRCTPTVVPYPMAPRCWRQRRRRSNCSRTDRISQCSSIRRSPPVCSRCGCRRWTMSGVGRMRNWAWIIRLSRLTSRRILLR